jgi:hypothetical protein
MAESDKPRLRDLFRDHPAWNLVIITAKKGLYQIADPPS